MARSKRRVEPLLHNVLVWLAIVVLLTLSLVIIGYGNADRAAGVIIDTRNQMSLSRMQAVAWTILVLSAILTIAMFNIRIGTVDQWSWIQRVFGIDGTSLPTVGTDDNPAWDALRIEVPTEIWSLLGISTASLVAAGVVKSDKRNHPPNDKALQKQFTNEASKAEGNFVREGRSVGYASPADAKFSDFFTGDEVGAYTRIELAKLQMFFFTVIVIFAYAVTLAGMFGTLTELETLPDLTEGIVLFLAISHAGYVADKAVPSMPSGATPPPDAPSDENGTSSSEMDMQTAFLSISMRKGNA